MTRIFHTADWHLGARLVDQERSQEHGHFFEWFFDLIQQRNPDVLIVAGDIFDNASPSQAALSQYYNFLARLVAAAQTQVLILGGNHDSPQTLHAPRQLLKSLRVHVVGSAPTEPEEAVLTFGDVTICAVPYLRERDVRKALPGQSFAEITTQIREGVRGHYRRLLQLAREKGDSRPILTTGHLTLSGATLGSGEREIHLGNLSSVGVDCFDGFGYVALGHVHRAQAIGGLPHIRYCGPPVPLNFGEAECAGEVVQIDCDASGVQAIEAIEVPRFRQLRRVSSSTLGLAPTLTGIRRVESELPTWFEITLTDGYNDPGAAQSVRAISQDLHLSVLKVVTPRPEQTDPDDSLLEGRALADLHPRDVFLEALRRRSIDPASTEASELLASFEELLSHMHERDLEPAHQNS